MVYVVFVTGYMQADCGIRRIYNDTTAPIYDATVFNMVNMISVVTVLVTMITAFR
jgi:hypothetical protein